MSDERILYAPLRERLVSAEAAAALIQPGETVAMSGFTGSGYPKAVPMALAQRIEAAHLQGQPFQIKLMTGASTAPELDGALAKADGIAMRMPFQSDPDARQRINAGTLDYIDIHLSHVAQHVWFGFYGQIDTAVVEVSAIRADGSLVPSTSIGNNKTWLDLASKVIIEVNDWQPAGLDGMHDVYYGTALPPQRKPIPLIHGDDRIGEPSLRCDPDKIVAVVRTHGPDRNSPFAAADDSSERIAEHLIAFLRHEVDKGRLPASLLPLQSGVGNIPNAVLAGLARSGFRDLEAFTEVIQDGMLALLRDGVLRYASCTGFALSPEGNEEFKRNIDFYRQRIIMRTQEISNHPEPGAPARLHRHERHDRGRPVRQRQFHPRDGQPHHERHRRFRRLCAQRLPVDLPEPQHRQGRQHFVDRADGQPCRPHRTRCLGDRHRTRPGRSARPHTQATRTPVARSLRTPALPRCAGRLCGARQSRQLWQAHPHLLTEALSWHQRWLETGDMLG